MRKILALFFMLALLGLWLTACGSTPPLLAVPDEPTLVYLYTDG